VASVTVAIKSVVKRFAPAGTRRRHWLGRLYWLMRRGRRPHRLIRDLLLGPLPTHLKDPYDLHLLNRFLRRADRRPLRDCDPARDEADAARWILLGLLKRPQLRKQFPQALSDGAQEGYCRLLCAELGTSSVAAQNVRAAFERKLGARVRQAYDEFRDWRESFPLALTPRERGRFLRFLLESARPVCRFSVEEILWFHLQNAEDPGQGIAATYLVTPSWQERVPHGLTRFGWGALCDWLCAEHGFDRAWLAGLPQPRVHHPNEESLLVRIAHPESNEARSSAADVTVPGINILGHFRYVCGLGEAAHNVVRALEAVGVPHSKRDVPAGIAHDEPDRTGYLGLEPYDTSLLLSAPEPLVDYCYPLAGLWKRPGTYRVAVWYWELEAVPPEWRRHAALLSEIWAPTRFIHDAMAKVMPIPVTPMLPGIVPPQAPSLSKRHFGLDPDRFTFLFMFDMNSVLERKNPIGLVEAFRRAFPQPRDVQLVIKVTRGAADPAGLARLRTACAAVGPAVVLIDRLMPRKEVYALTKACDCYVSLHRSEGFGLTIAEAMFFGKPVVATGYSGNLDFMTPDTSVLIPYKLVPLERDLAVYRKGSLWAEPSLGDAAEALRWVFEHPSEAQSMGERGRAYVEQLLSLQAYGLRMQRRLAELRAGRGGE
jgi:glycosyltransferase involved in cell wall biosynthesis